jgi:tetratricopeptide (TPR) repeat protein
MNAPVDPRSIRLVREAEGYYELGLFAEALARAEQLLAEGALELPAAALKAECLRALGRWEEGVAAFERVVQLDASAVAGYVGIGWCQKRTGRIDLAKDAMERLLVIRPGEAIGLFNLACYCALAGERERAFDLLEQAVTADDAYRTLAATEEDLQALRPDPRFRRLLRRRT